MRCSQHFQTKPIALWCSFEVKQSFPQIPVEHLATVDLLLKVDHEDLPVCLVQPEGHTSLSNGFKHNLDKESEVQEVLSVVFIYIFCDRFGELC